MINTKEQDVKSSRLDWRAIDMVWVDTVVEED